MKVNEKEKFKKLLLKERERILKGLKSITDTNLNKTQRDASGDLSGYSFHMADMASDSYAREFSLDLASGEQELLYDIDDAIKRITEGTYGQCQTCNKKLSTPRLKAVPHARLCKRCKEKEEQK